MQKISPILLFAYSALALPLAFSGLPMYIYAPDLYTTSYGVQLAHIGILLLCIRLVDALQDPLIGMFSDRWHRFRFHIIGASLVLLAISFTALYNPPAQVPALLWFALCMVAAAFSFSTISINYNALGSLWSHQPHAKTTIVAAREAMGLIGLLLATLTPPLLRLRFSTDAAYKIYAALFVAIAMVTFMLFQYWRSFRTTEKHEYKKTVRPFFAAGTLLRKPFGPLFVVYGLSTLASSIPGVLVVFFIRDKLQLEALTGQFLAIYFLAGILGMPLWKSLAARIGKKQCWRYGMLMGLICFIGAYWLRPGDAIAYGAICFFSGLALGAELVLPLSIASDFIDKTEHSECTSSVFSILLFLSKLSLALASGGSFLLLSRYGYTPGTIPAPSAAVALSAIYAVVPAGIKILAVAAASALSDD
jgi:GPH family glycoside/pentoside/hexuronide:cation symporter